MNRDNMTSWRSVAKASEGVLLRGGILSPSTVQRHSVATPTMVVGRPGIVDGQRTWLPDDLVPKGAVGRAFLDDLHEQFGVLTSPIIVHGLKQQVHSLFSAGSMSLVLPRQVVRGVFEHLRDLIVVASIMEKPGVVAASEVDVWLPSFDEFERRAHDVRDRMIAVDRGMNLRLGMEGGPEEWFGKIMEALGLGAFATTVFAAVTGALTIEWTALVTAIRSGSISAITSALGTLLAAMVSPSFTILLYESFPYFLKQLSESLLARSLPFIGWAVLIAGILYAFRKEILDLL